MRIRSELLSILMIDLLLGLGLVLYSFGSTAATMDPVLYSDSPLSASPGQLFQVMGAHLDNVKAAYYVLAYDDGRPVVRASNEPVKIVARNANPERLTLQAPEGMMQNRTYIIHVEDADERTSNAILLNAPKPGWFSPSKIATHQTSKDPPRLLKVAGRNLRCGANCALRLAGQTFITLHLVDHPDEPSTQSVMREFSLPNHIPAGKYAVQYSRDGMQWLQVGDRKLDVVSPSTDSEISVADPSFGSCSPDDHLDDYNCFRLAISAAAKQHATLIIPNGEWDIQAQDRYAHLLLVPDGVSLRGNPIGQSRVTYHSADQRPLFILSGNNRISHLQLVDASSSSGDTTLIAIGLARGRGMAAKDITITDNVFITRGHAIIDSGIPATRLLIFGNDFYSESTAIYLAGNRQQEVPRFSLIDSSISGNNFHVRNRSKLPSETPIASEIGGSFRLDFSGNHAIVDSRSEIGSGWRAGYFFHLQDNHEDLLVSNNVVECTGSGGDGEAIALDNNANSFAYPFPVKVLSSTNVSVTVSGVPSTVQNGASIDSEHYYLDHWLQIVQGAGNGQARRISGYRVNINQQTTTFLFSAPFAVAPDPVHSWIFVSRLFFMPTIVGNKIDNSTEKCAQHINSDQQGGSISLWAQTHSGAVSSNSQINSEGIVVKHTMGGIRDSALCRDCEPGMIRHVSLDITDNLIVNEHTRQFACDVSGIQLRYGAAPNASMPIPVIGLNTRISGNHIRNTGGPNAGAIYSFLDWHAGPSAFFGSLLDGILIDNNLIDNESPSTPTGFCSKGRTSFGIRLTNGNLLQNSVLYRNTCHAVSTPLFDQGRNTLRLCGDKSDQSCECPNRVNSFP